MNTCTPHHASSAALRRPLLALLLLLLGGGAFAQSPFGHAPGHGHEPNPMLFPKDAYPYGRSMAQWAEQEAKWLRAQPLATNPAYDPTGIYCANDQHGPVWFLPTIGGPPIENASRSCTIPRGKAIFLDIGHVTDEFPCPAQPDWHPAPGQSLYDFLIKDDNPVMGSVNALDVTLDGEPLEGVLAYRYISSDVFALVSDRSLQAKDPCITGQPQPAIVDGFYMMFRPLERGFHTLIVHGTNTYGDDKTYNYYITVK